MVAGPTVATEIYVCLRMREATRRPAFFRIRVQ